MRKTKGWTGLRSAVIALALVAWTATSAMATSMTKSTLAYTTSGQIDPTTGVSGTSVISYVPLMSSNTLDLSSGKTNAGLGNFVLAPLPDGTTTTYDNTPFKITLLPGAFNGDASAVSNSAIVVTGKLNGEVSGTSQSTVVATFDPVSNSSFALGTAGKGKFTLPTGSLLLAPSTSNSGTTSAQALITFTSSTSGGGESPVPEPSTVALFLTTIGGLGLRRYVQSRRGVCKV